MSALTWAHLRDYIKPGFPIYFVVGTSLGWGLVKHGTS